MGITETLAQFFISAAAIVLAGVLLAYSADKIAELTQWGRLIVGSIFLAGATSLPEFFVDLSAVRRNMPNLAVGDLMGSSLFNLLILAIADLIHHSPGKIFSRAPSSHTLSASTSINLTALAGLAILLGPQTKSFVLGGLGIGVILILAGYLFSMRLIFKYQSFSLSTLDKPKYPLSNQGRKTLYKAVSIYLGATLLIVLAAPYLTEAAAEISDITGLGRTFIGTTLVAFCTSLPELVSTLTSVRMGSFELALGNIYGSNSFNMILLVPLDLAFEGSLLASVSSGHVLTCLFTIVATSVAVMGHLYPVESRKRFIEPDAWTIISVVFAALTTLYFFGNH